MGGGGGCGGGRSALGKVFAYVPYVFSFLFLLFLNFEYHGDGGWISIIIVHSASQRTRLDFWTLDVPS